MIYHPSLYIRILLCFVILSISHFSFGQAPKLKSTSWRDNWKIELKTGFGALLTDVPEKYLDRINNVNIPKNVPGVTGILSFRKGLTPHLEMGYQFDYMQINGNVEQNSKNYNVRTQTLGNSFLVLYNLKKTDVFRPRFNYFGYYRIGAVSLKNDPVEILQDGSQVSVAGSSGNNKYQTNVAVITGLGIGLNYQFTNNLNIVGSFDLNRSSDAVADIYKFHKIFYHSSNTVNNYSSIAVGLCYSFNLSKRKKSTFTKAGTETDKRLIQSKISREKGNRSKTTLSIWYKPKN
ncbi:MAG: hypothetical protein Q8N05_16815 [Bacteroidota bacterium]|nr:hypothetical protein [Bacteroidota bacterium]